ncbi:MAG: hypothetical protein RIM99_02545 [Cyclobacteriaceae bacterium]
MKKEKALELWQDRLTGEISEQEERELKSFLDINPEVAAEWKDLEQTWELFSEIERPEPSLQMDARFEGMMAAWQTSRRQHSNSIMDSFVAWFTKGWQVGLAALVLGLFVGWWLLPTQGQKEDISQLSSEIQDMKKLMMLTLIEQPKAQERIRAVNMVSDMPSADEKVIEALITTLNYDDNLNVRLASLESLLNYGDKPEVRHALIDALKMQESAIMLVSIADALVTIQEKSSIDEMEKLKESVKDQLVKDKLEESIKTLTNS